MSVSLIVLAAGMGTRMNSDLPKVLHHVAAAPLLHHALAAGRSLDPSRIVVVTGHGAEEVAAAARALDEEVRIVRQKEQLGTGHAVLQAAPELAAAFAAEGRNIIGIYLAGINQDTLVAAAEQFQVLVKYFTTGFEPR